ncbi:geranylgeranyl reductase family protein [Cyclobacterium xiamenense]|uniref:geranylgeranyl reductase family protein n=1 Tax=Cyclobacterium xiamenense TaxID=1297121 RepID=UPI0012B807A5|nr:geranylgeranyl reductase family protein [Cyclobacterium xiamenense]
MKTYDIAVIGTGPAGAMAAYTAAAGGKSVLLIEKEQLPRYKTCGGGLVFRGRSRLPFALDGTVEKECREIEVYFEGSDHYFLTRREQPIISMVMRDSFDSLLVDKAREKGAELLQQCALQGLQEEDEELLLQTSRGAFRTRYLIAADGALSPTAKLAGWEDSRKLIPALEYEVEVNPADFERLSRRTRFDVDAVPYGYAWCFPKKNHLSIGVGCLKKQKINLKAYYAAYLEKLEIREIRSASAHGFQIPIAPRQSGFSRGRVFLAGDAAGFADPLTAEGISNALYSGELAAQALVASGESVGQAGETYQRLLEERLLPELKTSSLMAWVFYAQPQVRNWLLQKYGQRGCEILTDMFMGNQPFPDNLKQKLADRIPLLRFG